MLLEHGFESDVFDNICCLRVHHVAPCVDWVSTTVVRAALVVALDHHVGFLVSCHIAQTIMLIEETQVPLWRCLYLHVGVLEVSDCLLVDVHKGFAKIRNTVAHLG